MKMRIAALLLAVTLACSVSAADPEIEQTLRDLDAQWSEAAAAKNLEKTISYYTDDAIVLPPNEAAVTSKDAISNMWKELLDSVSSISWKAAHVKVAKSGDMAFVTGSYEMTMKNVSGNAANDRGKYLAVFEKQADGTWKCGADMFSSDLPAGDVD